MDHEANFLECVDFQSMKIKDLTRKVNEFLSSSRRQVVQMDWLGKTEEFGQYTCILTLYSDYGL